MNLNHIQTMGVINMTPNSFSDGGQFNSETSFSTRFDEACSDFDILDLGAESTAPFNSEVSFQEEMGRFEKLLYPLLENLPDNAITISLDTYKVKTFTALYEKIKDHWPNTKLLFNDVSGKIDDELLDLMASNRKFSYVYSHSLAPTRAETQEHIKYTTQENIIQHVRDYFKEGLKTLKNFNKEIILDPCFGFSKSREQNHFLIKNIEKVFEDINPKYSILLGVSRKSFLRFPRELSLEKIDNQKILDAEQSLLFSHFARTLYDRNLIFRVHDLNSYTALKNTLRILD